MVGVTPRSANLKLRPITCWGVQNVLQINPEAMISIAKTQGWIHARGQLAGEINAAAMAEALGVATSTISRAYEGSTQASATLAEKLHQISGLSFDEILLVLEKSAEATS